MAAVPLLKHCLSTANHVQRRVKPRSQSALCPNHGQNASKSYENLVDMVVRGNVWSILIWPCFVRGMAVGGCSTAEALPEHALSRVFHACSTSFIACATRCCPRYQILSSSKLFFRVRCRSDFFPRPTTSTNRP